MDWQEAIFGPGWFWSLLGIVLVVVSLLGISRQIRSSGAANALQRIETLQDRWDSPRMAHARLATVVHLKAGPPDEAGFFTAEPIYDFFLNLQILEREGHISIAEISDHWGLRIHNWMVLLEPTLDLHRRQWPDLVSIEPLLARLSAYERKVGKSIREVTEETREGLLDYVIAYHTAKLKQEADFLAGSIPSLPTPEQVT